MWETNHHSLAAFRLVEGDMSERGYGPPHFEEAGMEFRTLSTLFATVLVSGATLVALPSIALAQSDANPLRQGSERSSAESVTAQNTEQGEARTVTIRTPEAREARARASESMEDVESATSDDDKGFFFRLAIGAGYSRDQTLEFNDNYSIAQGAYADVELAPGFKIDAYKAVHLWLHWQYPSINERGNFTANSGEPRSVVDLGLGYTRQSEVSPLFVGFNAGVSLAFVDAITDGLRADEVGSPGVGAAAEILVGLMFPVSDSLSMGFAGVGGARLIFTGDETFNGYYGGGRLLLAIH